MVLYLEEWEYLNFCSNFHIQYLLMSVPIQRCQSVWSQSNWIILLQHIAVARQSHCKRRLCRLSQWHCWTWLDQDPLFKTVMLQLIHSKWSIHNHAMMHKHVIQSLYWEVKLIALMYPNDHWLIQINGKWCLPFELLACAICLCIFKDESVMEVNR